MKPLFTNEQFKNSKTKDKLPCECYQCNKNFYLTKHDVQRVLNPKHKRTGKFCSKQCQSKFDKKSPIVNCQNCDKEFKKWPSQIIKHINHFCSKSCAATYNNKHKTTGTKRSKLESYIEIQLAIIYPNLKIDFNKKDAINSELDIYIPSLKLAFELNGIFHYEPIYGPKKLNQIQENDISKTKSCHDAKIDLCVIDVSQQKYVKPSTSQKYLDIIIKIINERLIIVDPEGIEPPIFSL